MKHKTILFVTLKHVQAAIIATARIIHSLFPHLKEGGAD